MMKFALVFGFSEECYSLCKQLLLSFHQNVAHEHYTVDAHAYMCNFKVIDKTKYFTPYFDNTDIAGDSYAFVPFSKEPDIQHDMFFWRDNIYLQSCNAANFNAFFLPDIALYQHFADNYAKDYDYVIYLHDDITFRRLPLLDYCHEILKSESSFSIICQSRIMSHKEISIRMHPAFIAVNTNKFKESNLSFINDYVIIDSNEFYVFKDGGTGLLSSFYSKKSNTNQQWEPFPIMLHDVDGIITCESHGLPHQWVEHLSSVEFDFKGFKGTSVQKQAEQKIASSKQFFKDNILYCQI